MISFIRFFSSFLIFLGIISAPVAEYTPLENRAYTDAELTVEPDESKYIKVTVPDTGKNIYQLTEGTDFGYRYGPSLIYNADGSIDAFFAAPGRLDEWDWITYRHSPDGGESWTDELKVLAPTPDSPDFFSCCDPGAIKIGKYYYLGYTSTINKDGIDNNVFVARSLRPEGPYEKWNGNGWGGKPQPIIKYTGDPSTFGAGEPSLVVLGDTLYIYYTWRDGTLNQTRVSTADASSDNWPATLQYQGVAINHLNGACDSADVKYIEDYGKFIAVNTIDRFTEESSIGIYMSNDGLTFTESYSLKTNISHCCHNSGISSRPNGHIRLEDDVFLAYAYGNEWGFWPTRMHKVDISLIDKPDFSDYSKSNAKTVAEFNRPSWYVNYIGISTDPHEYVISQSGVGCFVDVYKFDTTLESKKILSGVKLSNYDKNIIEVNGTYIKPVSKGQSFVTAEWKNHTVDFIVTVV